MKLNFGRRLVLFVHWLLSLAACALGVALFVWPECRATAASLLQKTDVFIYAIAVLVVYLLFAAGSVAIIFGGRKRNADRNFIIVESNDTGRTRIAVSAVEQMIRQAVRGVSGIAQMKAEIINSQNSISINADVVILNGAHVPTVTANIQRAIRGYIEQNCGVAVRGVGVSVHSLAEAEEVSGKRGRRKKTKVGEIENPTPVVIPYDSQSYVAPQPQAEDPRERTASIPVVAPEPAPVEPEEAPISLTLDPAPAEPEQSAPEESAEPAEEAPAEPAPEALAEKKPGFFSRLFGKKKVPAPAEETPAEEVPAQEEPVAPETEEEVAVEEAEVLPEESPETFADEAEPEVEVEPEADAEPEVDDAEPEADAEPEEERPTED